MSGAIPPTLPMDPTALLTHADETQVDEAKEDKKLRKAQETSSFDSQIDAAQKSVDQNRKAADERLQAQKDKTNGIFAGLAIALIIIVAVVVSIVSFGAAAPAAIAAGAALIGLAMAGGAAGGNAAASGNEDAANKATEKADNAKVFEKEMEKLTKQYGDDVEKADDLLKQVLQSQRNRNDDYRNTNLAG